MLYLKDYTSPLGKILLASDGEALTGLWFEGQRFYPAHLERAMEKNVPPLICAEEWLKRYFDGSVPDFTPPLHFSATPFQQEVWNLLLTIPYGTTVTYGALAKQIAQSRGVKSISAQAVGNAVARNPVSLIVPCHRVIGANGALTGYAGGLDKKAYLLNWEKQNK